MRVLYFHQHFSTPKGAAGTRSYEMAQMLLELGHNVTMVCGSYSNGETGLDSPFVKGKRRGIIDGIDVIEFNLSYGNDMSFIKRTWIFLKFAIGSIGVAMREPADVVFATTTPLTAGIPGIFARWFRRKPFVFEVRDLWPELPKAMGAISNPIILWLMSILEWLSYHSANRLIGLSPGIVEGIVKRGIHRSKIELVPNGCDIRLFVNVTEARRPDGVGDQDLLAVFSGTHGMANGLGAVLDAAMVLKLRERSDIKIALIGQGGEKPDLVARAKYLDLTNVQFIDPMPKTELIHYLKGADLGLQILRNVPAFYFGTSPNKFFDYISAGLPVLNNYPGWLANIIQENDCGYVVPPDEPEMVANALIEAADSKSRLKEMGVNARLLAEQEFSRTKLAMLWCEWVTGSVDVVSEKND